MKELLPIGELARRTGVDAATIRYYEKAGSLRAPRRLENGYRAYRAADVDRLRFVARARRLGFSLSEIAEVSPAAPATHRQDVECAKRFPQRCARRCSIF